MAGLTPTEAQRGIQIVRKARETGLTHVMVEHVKEVVMPLVDRAVVLHYGEVLAEGHPKDVVRDESVISAYLGDRRRAAS
jgi:branched-chain amino acid transport system ATP-binding protein